MLFMATLRCSRVALDAKTGNVVWDVKPQITIWIHIHGCAVGWKDKSDRRISGASTASADLLTPMPHGQNAWWRFYHPGPQ